MGLSFRPVIIGTAAEITASDGMAFEEGTLAYATDSNQSYRYSGSAWALSSEDASDAAIADAGGYTTATTVEAAIQELYKLRVSAFREDFFTADANLTNGILKATNTGGTNDVPFAIVTDGLGGTAAVTTGSDANAAGLISGPLSFKPSTMGPIWMEARFKVVAATAATDGDFYVGWIDDRSISADLPYVVGADGLSSTDVPTEAAAIGYTSVTQTSGDLTTGELFIVTTKEDTDTLAPLSPVVTKDSAYHVYRVEISVAGTVTAYVDGVLSATVATGITAATALGPFVNAVTKAAHVNTLTIDYIEAGYTVANAV